MEKIKSLAADKKEWILLISISIILTATFSIFAYSTSPLYPNNYGYDSAFFRFIGKQILKGKIPYIDIWDHKGPIIYYIQALGAVLGTKNQHFSLIFLMQLFSMFLSIILFNEIDKTINKDKRSQIRFLIISICSLGLLYTVLEGGNFTEEWSLPIICFSLFLFSRYLIRSIKNPYHPCKYAFLHGICLSLLAFIRINNAITICMGVFVILIYLIIKKQFKNIVMNIIFGFLGISTVAIPILLFFYFNHALEEMINALFIHNFKYFTIRTHDTFTGIQFFIRYSSIIASYFIIVISFLRKHKFELTDFLASAIVTGNTILLIRSNVYLHYSIIYIPVYFYILCLYVHPKLYYSLEILVSSIFFIFCIYICVDFINYNSHTKHDPVFPTVSSIPYNERVSAIAVNVSPEIYLNTGIIPCSRFVANQQMLFTIQPEFEEEFIKDLQNKKPLWIINIDYERYAIPFVEELIKTQYVYQFSDPPYSYYRLVE